MPACVPVSPAGGAVVLPNKCLKKKKKKGPGSLKHLM